MLFANVLQLLDPLLGHGVRVALRQLLLEFLFALLLLLDLRYFVHNDHVKVNGLILAALPLLHFALHLLHFVFNLLLLGGVDVVDQVKQLPLHFLVLVVQQLSQHLLVPLLSVVLGLCSHQFRNVGGPHGLRPLEINQNLFYILVLLVDHLSYIFSFQDALLGNDPGLLRLRLQTVLRPLPRNLYSRFPG